MNEQIELRDLRYFTACCQTGSLSQAAAMLQVAQPTLSHALARLERQVGSPLLSRPRNRRQPMQPTERGQLVLARAREALAAMDHLSDDLTADGPLRGQLRVGSIQSLNLTLLPAVVATFAVEHPQVQVVLHTFQGNEIANAVRREAIDLALSAGRVADLSPLRTRELYREAFIAIVRRDDPLAERKQVAVKDLKSRELLLVPESSYSGQVVHEACATAGIQPTIRLEMASGEALRETVRNGLGITVLPSGYLAPNDPDLVAIPFSAPRPERQVLVIDDPTRASSRLHGTFLATLDHHVDASRKN